MPLGILAVLAWLVLWPGLERSAGAQEDFRQVGDERPVGKNRTGEECRLRLVESRTDRLGLQRFALYCDGWTQPSGAIRRFRATGDFPPARVVSDSPWQRTFSERLGDCGAVEPTSLASGAAAALRECKRVPGGWRVLVLATTIGLRTYGLETFPTNLPLLELAVEVLEKRRSLGPGAGVPALSAAIRRAETMVGASGRLIGIQDVGAHATLYRLGTLQNHAGHWAESEASFRRALEIEERAAGLGQPASGMTLAWVALNVGNQERFTEADQLFGRAEPLVQRSFGMDDRGRYLAYRALVERRRGSLERALKFAQDGVQAREDAARTRGRDTETSGVAFNLTILAKIHIDLKRFDAAERVSTRALGIVTKPGPDAEFRAWWTAQTRLALGEIYREQKRFAEARREYQLATERYRLLFGDSARVALGLAGLALLSQAEGNLAATLQIYRQLAEIQTKDGPTRERARPEHVVPYLDALLDAATAAPDQREQLHAEAFVAAQIPRGGETARAITNMAARLDAADPAIRTAAREYQEASRQRNSLRQALALETLAPPDKRDPQREATLRRELRAAEEKAANLEARLQADLPRYARLTSPRPVPVAELVQILHPGEALLTFLPTQDATYVFLVRDSRVHVHRVALPLADLTRAVQQLRGSFEVTGGKLGPFDVATAHRLYQLLIAPAADQLAGVRHLLTVPAGPLLSLPLALLVTRPGPPSDTTDYRRLPWLAREFAISVLPSTASLKDLRGLAGRSAAPRPFIGFGDPAFAGAGGDTRSMVAMASLCRQGEPMDADLIRGLPRLPETAHELTQIARALGAEASAVVLGGQVTETNVRRTDLTQYRVVAFATHGLLPGELRCQAEPALVLTPPGTASAVEDGLLDAGEVAQLRLDADWVVLSACNTAGPDGKLGGESLSGLARSFFYAGARALLVSHWAVASQATVILTTGMFQTYGRDPSLGRAEALRRSQAALWSQHETSHPFFWAPFTVVGDGGAPSSNP